MGAYWSGMWGEEEQKDKGSEGLLERLPEIPKDDEGFVVSFDIGLFCLFVLFVFVCVCLCLFGGGKVILF